MAQDYYSVVKAIKGIAARNGFITTWSHGDVRELDINNKTLYPILHMVSLPATEDRHQTTFQFDLYLMDIQVNSIDIEGMNEYDEQYSDLYKTMKDIIGELDKYGQGDVSPFEVVLPVTIEPFKDYESNKLIGWRASLSILVDSGISNCEFPEIVTPMYVRINSQDALCNGGSGFLTAVPNDGVPPYTYLWSTGETTQGISQPAGTYSVTVTDGEGSTDDESASIGEPDAIVVNPSFVEPSCFGDTNGSARVDPTGGTPPFTYLWSNAATTQEITGIGAGSYSVTVTDANGCQEVANIEVTEPALLTVAMSGTNDTGTCNGTATATPSGGTTPYTYLWDDPSSQTTQTATNLCFGTYGVVVTDDNGCQVSGSFEVEDASIPDGTFLDKYSLVGITDLVTEDMGGGVTRHYLTSFSLGKFAVVDFDGTNFTEVYLSPVLSAKPFQLHIDSTHIYYGSNTDNDVCKIPKSDLTSVTSVDVGVSTWEIAEIDTDYIVVANGLSQSFKVLDKATLSVQQTVSTPSINRTRRPLVKGNYLFVIDETSERIEVYEWNDVTKQFNTTPVEVVTNRGLQQMYLDGNTLFVGNNTDEAFILDVTDPTAITDISSFTGLPTSNTFRPYISSGGNFIVPDKINPDGILAYNSAQTLQYDVIDGTNFDDPFVIRDNNNVLFAANANGDLTAHAKLNP